MRPSPDGVRRRAQNEEGRLSPPLPWHSQFTRYSVMSTPSKVMSPSGLWTKPVTFERIGT
jgi:hypothetical protein